VNVNLDEFDVESGATKGAKLELFNKLGKKSGEWILLLGMDSRDAQSRIAEQAQDRVARATNGDRTVTVDMLRAERCELLAALTKEWSFKTADGNPFPCTPGNVRQVYMNSVLIREQVEEFVNRRANFLRD
jgi:hypothetical protein